MGNLKKNISTILSELSEQTTGLTCKLIKMTSHKMLRKKKSKIFIKYLRQCVSKQVVHYYSDIG